MGIAIAIFYVPLYLIFSGVAIFYAGRLSSSENRKTSSFRFNAAQASGFFLAIVATTIYILLVPVHGNTDWDSFFNQLAATLLGPPLFGILAAISNVITFRKYSRHLVAFSSGVLYSTPVMPGVGFLLGVISEL